MDYISNKIEQFIQLNKGLYSLNGFIESSTVSEEFYSIASYLQKRDNEVENFVVGICLDKDYRYLLTLLASMYVGVTYVPLSKKLPTSRVNEIISIAEVNEIISERELHCDTSTKIINDILSYDKKNEFYFSYSEKSNLYIMFTSGSTGSPKGVIIPRLGYESFLKWMNNYYELNSRDRILFITEFTFDLSLVDVGLLIEKNPEFYFSKSQGSIFDIMNELEKYEINVLVTVPTNINLLLSNPIFKRFSIEPLKLLILSGSKVTAKIYDLVKKYFPSIQFYNGYGPTEATVFVTSKHFDGNCDFHGNNASVGNEISDMNVLILDNLQQRVEDGEVGQIYVTGSQLMLGYKNDPTKTEHSMIQIGDRIYYDIGDLGYIVEGNLYIVGRADDTIKTRGYRVNLSDIESYALKLKYVNEAVVIAVHDDNIENRLFLFLTLNLDIDKNVIFNDLKQMLPDYQMPADIIIKPEFPLNNSGKIAKKVLASELSEI